MVSSTHRSTLDVRGSAAPAPQLALAMKVVDGSAMLVLRHVAGEPCHRGQSHIGLTVLDQSGHKVALFGHGSGPGSSTAPADFTRGFVQLMQIPYTESCDPAGSYLAVATVGPYEGSSHRLRDRNRL
jgi:hypothetical protein